MLLADLWPLPRRNPPQRRPERLASLKTEKPHQGKQTTHTRPFFLRPYRRLPEPRKYARRPEKGQRSRFARRRRPTFSAARIAKGNTRKRKTIRKPNPQKRTSEDDRRRAIFRRRTATPAGDPMARRRTAKDPPRYTCRNRQDIRRRKNLGHINTQRTADEDDRRRAIFRRRTATPAGDPMARRRTATARRTGHKKSVVIPKIEGLERQGAPTKRAERKRGAQRREGSEGKRGLMRGSERERAE